MGGVAGRAGVQGGAESDERAAASLLPARMGGAAPPPLLPDCKKEACAIQACLKRRSFDAARCGDAVAALKACCGRLEPGASVHCPADNASGWDAGGGGEGGAGARAG